MQEDTFIPSQKIIDSVTTDSFLDYEKIKNVELLLTESGKQFALINPLHSNQSFLQEENGCRLFYIACDYGDFVCQTVECL